MLGLFLLAVPAFATSNESYYRYLRGMIAERGGDSAAAIAEYEKAVALDPQALQVYRDIAQLNLRSGHTEAALQAAERVRELAPQDASSYLFLGNVLEARGDVVKAAEQYEKALVLEPRNLKALENLGNYYGMTDPPKGLAYYQRYLNLQPNDVEILFQVGFLYKRLGQTDMALGALQQAVDVDPQEIAPHLALAELYESTRSTASAIGEYRTCLQLDPRNAAFSVRIGRLYYETKNWDQATGYFQKALVLEPRDSASYYWLARVAEEREQWGQAGALTEKAYHFSHDPQFLLPLAYYLSLAQRIPEAVQWLEKANRLKPQDPSVQLFLGIDYLDMNKPQKAVSILETACRQRPLDAQMHFQLGAALDRLNRFEPAVQEFRTVLEIDPKNTTAMNYLGYSFAERGIQLKEAETLIARAVQMEPKNGAFWDSLGWVHYKLGRFSEAVEELEKAVNLDQDAVIYEHLGDACWADQKPDKALGAWTKSLSLKKDNPGLAKKIAEAARRVTPDTDQRKYLKYIEGNFRQIRDLRGAVLIRGRWNKNSFESQGGIYYLAPDRFLLAIGAPSAPLARISVRGQKVRMDPEGTGGEWQGPELEGLSWLPDFFAGSLLAALDSPSVQVLPEKSLLHYVGTDEEAWVDPERGLLMKYSRIDPQGGRDVLEVRSYELVEGLWLPRAMRLENRVRAWQARLKLSGWQINQPQTAAFFETLP